MNTKYVRTTISLPENILFEMKKKALMEKRTIKELISEGLSAYLGKTLISKSPPKKLTDYFGAWGKGESGVSYVRRIRYSKAEKAREDYLKKLWK